MINSSQALAESLSHDDVLYRPPTFYVVSRKKLVILYLATFGLYSVYWFYKNWSNYKHSTAPNFNPDREIWPAPRGLFSIFFIHALFGDIKLYGHAKAMVADWNAGSQATRLVLTMIVSNVLDRLSYRSIGSPYTDIASLLILAPLLSQFLSSQHMINVSCDDPDGESNSRFTTANYVWITLGVIWWIFVIIGFFLPD
jgi:hypothetical protein